MPGVYEDKYETLPECLPWARPLSPSFGGGSPNPNNEDKHVLNDEVGWCSVPHAGNMTTGSQVFVFFENGDINYPVYFGVAQSGEGWFSEHPNQHCFRSDNIRVRIDENVTDERSTCKFDSYNTYNSNVAKANLERDCRKNGWTFDETKGNIKQLETRLDIEIEASKMNAVNLNIHGNVNMHIDGDWFVEHIGNYYEYREGDRYIKQDGNTYIEENGIYRKVLNGPESYEHNGNYTENQVGDSLITRHGKYHDQIDNNVSHIYGENYRMKVNKSAYEFVGHDKDVSVGHNFNLGVINNGTANIGGFFDIGIDTYLNFDVKDNASIRSREGNILLKTEGLFDLMDGPIVTCKGFKNLGTKGNIQFISTFGNINMQCIKNDAIADFNQRETIVPWNPSFLYKVRELTNGEFSITNAMLQGMDLTTDVDNLGDFISLLNEIEELKIYDGLPVFIPTKMIIQNPNLDAPSNELDLSWIPSFRNEPDDWRNIHDDVMWKLPGRMMGNINIETWAGDINIKTDNTIGCAGNINISAKENGGTLPGYKIGSVNISSYGNERVYPDPRDLFLDSNYELKEAKKYQLFSHGTNISLKPVLDKSTESIVKGVFGRTFDFLASNYNKFYDMYGINAVTYGHPELADTSSMDALAKLKKSPAPKLGCPKCISDYLLGLPGIQEIFYENENVIELAGGKHDYGFQRINPKDKKNPRGVFNIVSNDFEKISIGDGHAIEIGFMDNMFSTKNIGGFTINASGDKNEYIGKNSYKNYNYLRDKGKLIENYIYTETPFDFYSPECLNKFVEKIGEDFKNIGKGYDYVQPGKNIILAKGCKGPGVKERGEGPGDCPQTIEANFIHLDVMPKIEWKDGGYHIDHPYVLGEKVDKHEVLDFRSGIDYGFNFEQSSEYIKSMDPSKLCVNFYENETYSLDYDRWLDHQVVSGGNQRWFQVDKFTSEEHVELEISRNEYFNTLVDISTNYKKFFKFYDKGFAWWDNDKFADDLVQWFPDSEFEVKSQLYEQVFGEVPDGKEGDESISQVSEYREHKGWAKYGNHVKGGSHPEYVGLNGGCGASYTKAKSKGDKDAVLVDCSCDLWSHKRGAGVKEIHKSIRYTDPQPIRLNLNKCACGNNQSIGDKLVWSAATNINHEEEMTAENNNIWKTTRTGEVNTDSIVYTAAVNNHIVELNSDHATLVKDDQSDETAYATNTYKLCAGNIYRTLMKGNQDFYNFQLNKDQADFIITQTEHANNFELSQNGFNVNRMKVLNGTDSMWNKSGGGPGDGSGGTAPNPEDGQYFNNEIVISNGGEGDPEPPTPAKQKGIEPFVSGKNNFKYSNGENFKNLSENNITFNNGIGLLEGTNVTNLNNGNALTKGSNIVRVNNESAAGDTENVISLNNDHQNQDLNLTTNYVGGSPVLQTMSLYSSKTMNLYSGLEQYIKTPNLIHKVTSGDLNYGTFDLKTSSLINNNATTVINTPSLVVTADTTSLLGKDLTIQGDKVVVQKLVAVGEFYGHSTGSFNGCAMAGGLQYSTLWPKTGSHPCETYTVGGTVVTTTGIPTTATVVAPSIEAPINNESNGQTLEQKSTSIIGTFMSLFKSFIKLELSLLSSTTLKRK